MRALARGTVLAIGLSACTLLTQLDGLSEGSAGGEGGTDGTTGGDATLNDAPLSDAPPVDGNKLVDGGGDCGSPGPTLGLLAYYPFEEGTGSTVHDCTANHHDGTFVRPAASGTWTTGKKGGAIRVQAPDGCVDLGTPAQLQAPTMTVAAWININSYPSSGGSGYLIGQALNADVTGWRIGARMPADAGNVGWEHTTGGAKYLFDSPGPPTGTWHHLAMTFKANDALQIFVDGTRTVLQTALPPITFTSVSLRIGCRADDANYFDGIIDELRVYDRVLPVGEIAVLAKP